MGEIPCFLCGRKLTVRTDKNGKPYLICDPCGSQHFIRRKQGMERLGDLDLYIQRQKTGLAERMESLLQIQARLNEIDTLKKDVERLTEEAGIIFRDQEKLRARDAVQNRIDALLFDLEQIAEQID